MYYKASHALLVVSRDFLGSFYDFLKHYKRLFMNSFKEVATEKVSRLHNYVYICA